MTSIAQRPATSNEPLGSRESGDLAATVAANLTRIRNNLGINVAELAEWSGLAPEVLFDLEAGRIVPSLRVLWALAEAFEMPFGVLLSASGLGDSDFRVQRSDEGRVVVSEDGRFRSRSTSAASDPREPDVYEVTLAAGCLEKAAAHAPETFEHVLVVRGTLVVRSGDQEATLGPGDALFFRADRPHVYENPGPDETVLHLTMTYEGDWTPQNTGD